MKILVYDTECNSLDTEKGFIQEIAWAKYLVEGNKWRCIQAKSSLISWDIPYDVEPEAFKVTGLSREMCNVNGRKAALDLHEFMASTYDCDHIGGHNVKNYDAPMVLHNAKRSGPFSLTWEVNQQIDSLVDIDYPEQFKQKSLKYLALDHGYILNGAHQALNDVFASAHLFSCYDIEKTIENSKIPMIEVVARFPYNDPMRESRNNLLRANKFRWDTERKVWKKEIKENKLIELEKALGFSVSITKKEGV